MRFVPKRDRRRCPAKRSWKGCRRIKIWSRHALVPEEEKQVLPRRPEGRPSPLPSPEDYFAAFTATRRSATKSLYSRSRDSSSGWRRSDDGWTVATTFSANSDSNNFPRSRVTRNDGPKIAWAAVAPMQTSKPGLTTRSSASSQGRHAAISREFGFLWMRRLPRGSHLKFFTVFVTYTLVRSTPASSSA